MRGCAGILRAAAAAAMAAVVAVSTACGGGGTSYDVTVTFNSTVTQTDMDQVDRLIHRFNSSAEMRVMETFPPIGRVTIKTGTRDFCHEIETALDALPFVSNVGCQKTGGGSGSGG